jgi:hypothetical protein
MNELIRAVYLTYYLGQMGYPSAPNEFYQQAEGGLETAIKHAQEKGQWQLDPDAALLLEEVLNLHDKQIGSARAKDLVEASERLNRFVRSGKQSPFDGRSARESPSWTVL